MKSTFPGRYQRYSQGRGNLKYFEPALNNFYALQFGPGVYLYSRALASAPPPGCASDSFATLALYKFIYLLTYLI